MNCFCQCLNIYLLVDTSSSMAGEPIESVRQGIRAFELEWKEDFEASESARVSVILFDSIPRKIMPLCFIKEWNPPVFYPGGLSCLGQAFSFAEQCIKNDLAGQENLYHPLVFLFTDGKSVETWQKQAAQLKESCKAELFVCAAGAETQTEIFNQTATVIPLNTLSYGDFSNYFRWIELPKNLGGDGR